MVILHFEFVLAIESGNTFEVSDQVGRSDNRIPADDMNELVADLLPANRSTQLDPPSLCLSEQIGFRSTRNGPARLLNKTLPS